MPLALYVLAVATFAIGTTEFVVVGLLSGISADLSVSIPTAGLLVSLYALSIMLVGQSFCFGVPREAVRENCPLLHWRSPL
nr:MFS transporter [Bradyrhizobium sp. URHD0069]